MGKRKGPVTTIWIKTATRDLVNSNKKNGETADDVVVRSMKAIKEMGATKVAPNNNPPLSDAFITSIQKELRKETNRIRREYFDRVEKQDIAMSELRKQNENLIDLNNTLRKQLKLKAKTDPEVLEDVNRVKSYIERELAADPSKGWHVGNLWGRSKSRLLDWYDIKRYATESTTSDVATTICKLLEKVDKYSREVEEYDANLNRWAKQIIVGSLPDATTPWGAYYTCPKGGRCELPWLTKLIEENKFELKGQSPAPEAYPKVKVPCL